MNHQSINRTERDVPYLLHQVPGNIILRWESTEGTPSVRPAEPPVLPPALLKDVAGLYSKWKAVVQRTKYCTAHTADQFLIV
jgi:hypothetical protein